MGGDTKISKSAFTSSIQSGPAYNGVKASTIVFTSLFPFFFSSIIPSLSPIHFSSQTQYLCLHTIFSNHPRLQQKTSFAYQTALSLSLSDRTFSLHVYFPKAYLLLLKENGPVGRHRHLRLPHNDRRTDLLKVQHRRRLKPLLQRC